MMPDENTQYTPETEPKRKPKKSAGRELLEWVGSLAAALVIVLILQNFLFMFIAVDGHSMDTTLADGERLFVTVADVKFGDVERDDVVICHYPGRTNPPMNLPFLSFLQVKTNFVKRCVAVAGDRVYRQGGITHVVYETTDENGETVTVDEPLEDTPQFYPDDDYEPYTLQEGEYFVVGDNRTNSHDSRTWNCSGFPEDYIVGPITKDMLVGHVRCVIWPLNQIRGVE